MTKETFSKKIKTLGLTELQRVEVEILGLELARDEWKLGYERCQEITKKTLSILG